MPAENAAAGSTSMSLPRSAASVLEPPAAMSPREKLRVRKQQQADRRAAELKGMAADTAQRNALRYNEDRRRLHTPSHTQPHTPSRADNRSETAEGGPAVAPPASAAASAAAQEAQEHDIEVMQVHDEVAARVGGMRPGGGGVAGRLDFSVAKSGGIDAHDGDPGDARALSTGTASSLSSNDWQSMLAEQLGSGAFESGVSRPLALSPLSPLALIDDLPNMLDGPSALAADATIMVGGGDDGLYDNPAGVGERGGGYAVDRERTPQPDRRRLPEQQTPLQRQLDGASSPMKNTLPFSMVLGQAPTTAGSSADEASSAASDTDSDASVSPIPSDASSPSSHASYSDDEDWEQYSSNDDDDDGTDGSVYVDDEDDDDGSLFSSTEQSDLVAALQGALVCRLSATLLKPALLWTAQDMRLLR